MYFNGKQRTSMSTKINDLTASTLKAQIHGVNIGTWRLDKSLFQLGNIGTWSS